MSILQTNFESDFVVNATAAERPTVNRRPVVYYLKKYTLVKSNYKIHNKELLVIMRYLKVWDAELRSVLKGFDIITDYENIEYFVKK